MPIRPSPFLSFGCLFLSVLLGLPGSGCESGSMALPSEVASIKRFIGNYRPRSDAREEAGVGVWYFVDAECGLKVWVLRVDDQYHVCQARRYSSAYCDRKYC